MIIDDFRRPMVFKYITNFINFSVFTHIYNVPMWLPSTTAACTSYLRCITMSLWRRLGNGTHRSSLLWGNLKYAAVPLGVHGLSRTLLLTGSSLIPLAIIDLGPVFSMMKYYPIWFMMVTGFKLLDKNTTYWCSWGHFRPSLSQQWQPGRYITSLPSLSCCIYLTFSTSTLSSHGVMVPSKLSLLKENHLLVMWCS
jgi:hypothetical protein